MLKPSEIIRMAMNHPSYLAEDDGENWLCAVLVRMWECKQITESQCDYATDIIHVSLGDQCFLRSYLYHTGKIESRMARYQSQEYKQAAFEHWNKLIEKLEKEGKG